MAYKSLTQEQITQLLGSVEGKTFKDNIARMHEIYKLPTNSFPTLYSKLLGDDAVERLEKFRKTLLDEVEEVHEIIRKINSQHVVMGSENEVAELRKECLTDIADWFSDMTVYIRSEAMKFGIPLEDTLQAVMASNFTKVGETPVYDENGKVQKDLSRFVPPEDAISTIMFGAK